MSWRLAKSLEKLRGQINAAYPNRSKASDGTIGDTAHASGNSDHNPNAAGIVCAMDITNDPANGLDAWALAEKLRVNRHPAVKYIISNRQICGAWSNWQWQNYTGSNPHTKHVHISVGVGPDGKSTGDYDNTSDWAINGATPPVTPQPPTNVIGIATVIADAVNVRTKPTSQSPQGGSKVLKKGETFEYVAVVAGENVQGNNSWLKSKYGNYVSAKWLSYGAAPAPVPPAPAPKPKMALTTGVANVRSAPRLNAPLAGSKQLKAGVTFEYRRVVRGDSVRGNSNWVESSKGNFVHSVNVRLIS